MDPTTVGLLAFVGMMVLIVVGVPIGFAMLATASVGFFIVGRPNFAETQLSLTFIEQGTSFVFVAVPLYFLMGQLVQRTNIATDLYECIYRWLGRLPGGLAISSVVACAGFGAGSGGSGIPSSRLARSVSEQRRSSASFSFAIQWSTMYRSKCRCTRWPLWRKFSPTFTGPTA